MRQLHKKTTKFNGKDALLWLLVVVILGALIFGNIYFNTANASLRVAIILILALGMLGTLSLTNQGKSVLGFIKEARTELKKVVWPTRKETLQTSFLIFLIVLVASLILWGVDSLFALLVSSILV